MRYVFAIFVLLAPLVSAQTVEVPRELRAKNWMGPGGGSCCWASALTLSRWMKVPELEGLWNEIGGPANPQRVYRYLTAKNIDFAMTVNGDVRFLEKALKTRRGAAVSWPHAHMVNLVHFDDQWAGLLDNNQPDQIIWRPRNEFVSEWHRYGAWAFTIVDTPPPPFPSEANRQVQAMLPDIPGDARANYLTVFTHRPDGSCCDPCRRLLNVFSMQPLAQAREQFHFNHYSDSDWQVSRLQSLVGLTRPVILVQSADGDTLLSMNGQGNTNPDPAAIYNRIASCWRNRRPGPGPGPRNPNDLSPLGPNPNQPNQPYRPGLPTLEPAPQPKPEVPNLEPIPSPVSKDEIIKELKDWVVAHDKGCECDEQSIHRLAVQIADLNERANGLDAAVDEIKDQNQTMSAGLGEQMNQVVGQMQTFGTQLEDFQKTVDERLKKLEALPTPTTPTGPFEPDQIESGISHFVLVADPDDMGYSRVVSWVRRAKEVHRFIYVVERSQIPFRVSVLPQLVAYDLSGNAVSVDKGQYQVEAALQRIFRSEFR